MALVEIELRISECTNLVWFILAKSPIPVPQLSLLGPSRLLSKPFSWQQPVLGEAVPGFAAPPGTVPVRAPVKIAHVSLDELKVNASTPHAVTDCVAWLLISMVPDRLRIHLLRLESPGCPTQTFATPLFIAEQAMPLDDVEDVRAAAIILQDEVATLRFAVGANDSLLVPLLNLLLQEQEDDGWLIRIAGDIFADRVRRQLSKALVPPPNGTKIESGPAAIWFAAPSFIPGGIPGLSAGTWGVLGSVELEKEDACGDVDVSVAISVALAISPDIATRRVNLALHLASDVSDWDVFRCWLSTGGIASLVIGVFASFVGGIMVALQSLIMIAEFARLESGAELKGTSIGGGFTKVGSNDTSVWYAGDISLPAFPTGQIRSATVGPDGLVVRGSVVILALDHTVTFQPDGGPLETHWAGYYSCREEAWKTTCEVQSIVVRDLIYAPDLSAPSGKRLVTGNGVAVFPTTTFLPPGPVWLMPVTVAPGEWVYDAPSWAQGSPIVTPRRTGMPRVGEEILFFLHTSAGIKRFDIGPIPAIPEREGAPSSIILGVHRANCKLSTRNWTRLQEIQWLIDPPPYEYGIQPLRQWMLTFRQLPRGTSITVLTRGGQEEGTNRHEFNGAETGLIEVVTAADSEIALDHNLEDSDTEARVFQRWLLPAQSAQLPGAVESLSLAGTRNGSVIPTALIEGRWFTFGDDGLVELKYARVAHPRKQSTRSLSLPGGQVTVIWNNMIMTAIPYGPHERVVLHERLGDEVGS